MTHVTLTERIRRNKSKREEDDESDVYLSKLTIFRTSFKKAWLYSQA
jgi:hypothetical protein